MPHEKAEHFASHRTLSCPCICYAEKFTLTDVQHVCEAVLRTQLDKGAFRSIIKDEPALRLLPGGFLRGP